MSTPDLQGPPPFISETLQTGAVLPIFNGRVLAALEQRIVQRRSGALRRPGPEPRDQWLTEHVPVLSRGPVWIVPLAWMPAPPDGDISAQQQLRKRASELFTGTGYAFEHAAGWPVGLDATTDYASALVRAGGRNTLAWEYGDHAMVHVTTADEPPAPATAFAVHVLPKAYVWEDSGRRKKPRLPDVDLRWSWADVVALHAAVTQE